MGTGRARTGGPRPGPLRAGTAAAAPGAAMAEPGERRGRAGAPGRQLRGRRMRKPSLARRKKRRCGRMETAATKGWGRPRSREKLPRNKARASPGENLPSPTLGLHTQKAPSLLESQSQPPDQWAL